MPRVSAEQRERNRQLLIEAARRCADRKPFREVTVDDICAEASVSKGAFYTYFEHKEDLLIAMIDEAGNAFERASVELENSGVRPVEQARRLVRAKLRRNEDASSVQLNADVWSEMLTNDRVRSVFAESVRRQRVRFRELIEQAEADGELVEAPANALASIFLALSDGLLLHRALDPGGFKWKNVDRALDFIIAGLHRPPGEHENGSPR